MKCFITRGMNGLAVVLGLVLLAMVGLSVWNVIARYLFNSALLWADEVAIFAMIVLTWLGAVVAAWRASEISMSLLVGMLPATWQKPIRIVQQLIIAGICGWVTWLSWGYVTRLFRFGMTSDAARLPVWIFHGTITLSLACIALIAVWRMIDLLLSDRSQADPDLLAKETTS